MSTTTSINDADAYTDVVELCALLQCLGFSVKSLEASDSNISQDGGARTVAINCPASGVHVMLESANMSCSCPAPSPHNSGMWQVSGVAGGKHLDKEFGCTLLGSLPKAHRERLTAELREMIRCIKRHNDSVDLERRRDMSASVTDLKTPEKLLQELQADTPTRYRSLDTLTGKLVQECAELPAPRSLQRTRLTSASGCDANGNTSQKMSRQGTYTMSSTPGSKDTGVRRKNKTSSPIQFPQNNLLETLLAAQKAAEEVHRKLSSAIQKLNDECKDDSSMSSLVLDVSKIPVLKAAECLKAQFASSPNLSVATGPEDLAKSRLGRFESVSTTNLDKKIAPKDSKLSRLRRISQNTFKKDTSTKSDKGKNQDGKSKFRDLLNHKIATPVRVPQKMSTPDPSPNLSRNKYSHIKSTIPRLAKKE